MSIRSPGRAAFAHDGHITLLTREGFFLRRWRGQVAWQRLFWRDMLAVGTVLNLAVSFGALALLALGAPGTVAVALHFAPLPYNLFLFLALWRLARRPTPVVAAALAWLAVVTMV